MVTWECNTSRLSVDILNLKEFQRISELFFLQCVGLKVGNNRELISRCQFYFLYKLLDLLKSKIK